MPVNPYFNLYNATNEQTLLENLIIESIKMYGFDTFYIPQNLDDFDEVFREATARTYSTYYTVESYLKENLKFGGDGKFMSQELGLEIRDHTKFTISQKVFKEITGMTRPREGDLVYLPLDKKIYEIKFVDHQAIFYQLGKLMTWDLDLELFEYSGETFSTGIPEIDIISTTYEMDGTENDGIEDWNDQSSEIQAVSNTFIDFTESDPFAHGGKL
jgi:hypothetical protein